MLSCSIMSNSLPWTVALQAPLSMGFTRQGHWSGLPFPSPWDLPDPGIKPGSPALWADCLSSETGKKFSISGKTLISVSHFKRLGLKIATSSKPEGLSRGCCFVLFLWGVELGLGGTYVCPSLDHKQS